MSDNWFTETEREKLCVNSDCREHGEGSDSCDIPADKSDSPFVGESSVMGQMDAKVLQPTVETRTFGDDE